MKTKHLTFSLLAFTGLVLTGIFVAQDKTYSQDLDPAIAAQCGKSACCTQYSQAIKAAEEDWQKNLQNLIDQEKPASEMVDDAYENLRTYNCWLEYICRSVQYSGFGPIENVGTGLTTAHIGQAPGCQAPDELKMEAHYSSFVDELKNEPAFGTSGLNLSNDKINYFPSCMTDKNNENPVITKVNDNFEGCKKIIESKFGCSSDLPAEEFEACVQGAEGSEKNWTSATLMETSLKKAHADQRATALEQKLGDIVGKLNTMDENVTYLSNFLSQLDQRLACLAFQCT